MILSSNCNTNVRRYCLTFTLLILLCCGHRTRAQPLKGRKFRCCTLPQAPVMFRNETNGFSGLAMEYLRTIQDKLGFTCPEIHDMTPNLTEKGVLFSSFIKQWAACNESNSPSSPVCKCDIGIAGFMITKERFGLVEFLPTFAQVDMYALVHVSNTYTPMGYAFFLTTFTGPVWCAIACLAVMFTVVKVVDPDFHPPHRHHQPIPSSVCFFTKAKYFLLRNPFLYRVRMAVESTLMQLIGQSGADDNGKGKSTTRQWVLKFVILLCGLFLVLVYEASMTASLVQERGRSDFQSIEDIKACRISSKDVCIPRGGAVQSVWENSVIPGTQGECNNRIEWPKLIDSYDEIIELVANGKCKFAFVDDATALEAERRHCNTVVKTGSPTFFGGGIAFILPKNDPDLASIFANATIGLRGDGNLTGLDAYVQNHGHCSHSSETVLTFRMLAAFFISAFVACGLIFLEMILDPQGPQGRFPEDGEVTRTAHAGNDNGDDDDNNGDVEDPRSLKLTKGVVAPSYAEVCVSEINSEC